MPAAPRPLSPPRSWGLPPRLLRALTSSKVFLAVWLLGTQAAVAVPTGLCLLWGFPGAPAWVGLATLGGVQAAAYCLARLALVLHRPEIQGALLSRGLLPVTTLPGLAQWLDETLQASGAASEALLKHLRARGEATVHVGPALTVCKETWEQDGHGMPLARIEAEARAIRRQAELERKLPVQAEQSLRRPRL